MELLTERRRNPFSPWALEDKTPDLKGNKKILNAGCSKNFSVGTHFIDLYPQRKDVLRCDLDKDIMPYEDEFFDVVYAKCIFEHLTNQRHFLSECKRVLKKGGKIILITDNACFIGFWGSWLYKGKGFLHRYEGICGQDDRHYALYTLAHLEHWAKKFDLEIEHLDYEPPAFLDPQILYKTIIKKTIFFFLPKHLKSIRIKMIAKKRG